MTQRVLITGGASGLGLALAKAWLGRGARVLVGDLAPQRPSGLPDAAEYLPLDVTSEAAWVRAREWVTGEWGGLDVLVNNAGIATSGRIDVETHEEWQRVIDVNLLGAVRGCRIFTPVFKRQRGGHIVNVASLAGLVHGPGMASYNVTKAGVVALSETLYGELAPWQVRVSVVCPSFFRTNLGQSFASSDTALSAEGVKLITTARLGADDVAAEVVSQVERGRLVILPERQSRLGHRVKRLSPRAYRRALKVMARRIAKAPYPESPPLPGQSSGQPSREP